MPKLRRLIILVSGASIVFVPPTIASATPTTAADPIHHGSAVQPPLKQSPPQKSLAEQLKLTAAQKSKLSTLETEQIAAIVQLLNDRQKKTFETKYQAKHRISMVLPALALSETQKTQIQAIRQSYYQKKMAVLTPAQTKQLANLRQ